MGLHSRQSSRFRYSNDPERKQFWYWKLNSMHSQQQLPISFYKVYPAHHTQRCVQPHCLHDEEYHPLSGSVRLQDLSTPQQRLVVISLSTLGLSISMYDTIACVRSCIYSIGSVLSQYNTLNTNQRSRSSRDRDTIRHIDFAHRHMALHFIFVSLSFSSYLLGIC